MYGLGNSTIYGWGPTIYGWGLTTLYILFIKFYISSVEYELEGYISSVLYHWEHVFAVVTSLQLNSWPDVRFFKIKSELQEKIMVSFYNIDFR